MTAAAQFAAALAAYTPDIQAIARAALAKLRAQIPGAVELVYDNYNALVIAFASGPKMADVACSVALYPRWVTLFLMRGPQLPDPTARMTGSGSKIRQIRLASADDLDATDVRAIIRHATRAVATPFAPGAKRRMEIRMTSAAPRSRVPTMATDRPKR